MNGIENKLWKRSEKYLRFLQMVPFLRMVAVCNNLAFGTADEDSDIDLFIVAKSGRLFFVRSFVTFLLHFLGVRRHGNKRVGRFCLSFFVDDSALNLNSLALDNDYYLAYWSSSLVVFIDDGCFQDFSDANLWIDEYFAMRPDFRSTHLLPMSKILTAVRGVFQFFLAGFFGDLVEKFLKSWQLKRARKKAEKLPPESSVVVADSILKFHNLDRRRYYNKLWFDKFGTEKLTKDKFIQLFP